MKKIWGGSGASGGRFRVGRLLETFFWMMLQSCKGEKVGRLVSLMGRMVVVV